MCVLVLQQMNLPVDLRSRGAPRLNVKIACEQRFCRGGNGRTKKSGRPEEGRRQYFSDWLHSIVVWVEVGCNHHAPAPSPPFLTGSLSDLTATPPNV